MDPTDQFHGEGTARRDVWSTPTLQRLPLSATDSGAGGAFEATASSAAVVSF